MGRYDRIIVTGALAGVIGLGAGSLATSLATKAYYGGTISDLEGQVRQVTRERDNLSGKIEKLSPKPQPEAKRLSDDEIRDVYKAASAQAGQYRQQLEDKLTKFAERSGIKSPGVISAKDYQLIRDEGRREYERDPAIKKALDLINSGSRDYSAFERMLHLANEVDSSVTRRVEGTLFYNRNYPAANFSEPGLVFEPGYQPIMKVTNPKIVTLSDGTEAVYLGERHGNNVWAPFKDFGKEPGPYMKHAAKEDLVTLTLMRSHLGEFIKQIRKEHTEEQVRGLLNKISDKGVWVGHNYFSPQRDILNIMRQAHEGSYLMNFADFEDKPLTLEGLQKGIQEVDGLIKELNQIVGKASIK